LDGWWVVPRAIEQLEEATGKTYLVVVRGSRNYMEHLVSVGANPHYAFKGAVSWSTNWSPYLDFYNSVVAPCLDQNNVVGQDRTFWVAWSYRFMKTVLGGVTTASLSHPDVMEFVTFVADRFFDMLRDLDIPAVNDIIACIRDNLGLGVVEPTQRRREGE
jgi:hypothetical protein